MISATKVVLINGCSRHTRYTSTYLSSSHVRLACPSTLAAKSFHTALEMHLISFHTSNNFLIHLFEKQLQDSGIKKMENRARVSAEQSSMVWDKVKYIKAQQIIIVLYVFNIFAKISQSAFKMCLSLPCFFLLLYEGLYAGQIQSNHVRTCG